MVVQKINLVGQIFGQLVVVKFVGAIPSKQGIYWECRCKCGNVIVRRTAVLRDGSCDNCGCLARKRQSAAITVHGGYKTPEFRVWVGIRVRCYNKNSKPYKDYGGRGIKVCDRWLGDTGFGNFLADMGKRPTSKHTIERIDNDKDYCPENCKWATRLEQNNNNRRNVWIEYQGRKQTISQWAREFGINRNVLRGRVLEMRWSMERAVTEPVHHKNG